MRKRVIALIGRAGSGKSTLGKRFAEEFNCKYISTGDLARTMSDLSWEARGNLAPEDLMRSMVLAEIAKAKEHVIILDGMPRIADQVYFLTDHFNVSFVRVVCTRSQAKRRLMERGRGDDTEEAIEKRLQTYDNNIGAIRNVINGLAENGMIDRMAYIMPSDHKEIAYYHFKRAVCIYIEA